MKTARDWKAFYAREREALGERGLAALFARAPRVALPERGVAIFPHTRLEASGELVAAAARAAVESGRDEVLAIGVLHRSRGGEAPGPARGVHGPEVEDEEFSLDGFAVLLDVAARRAGRRPPRLLRRYPFLAGPEPATLPGLAELRAALARGAALVATTDPIHHGAGYGTPPEKRIHRGGHAALDWALGEVERALGLLRGRDFGAFLRHCEEVRSDFRDVGPVLVELLDGGAGGAALEGRVVDLRLVDYSIALGADEPTWVAGALAVLQATSA